LRRIELMHLRKEYDDFLVRELRTRKSKILFCELMDLIHKDTLEKDKAVEAAKHELEDGRGKRVFREHRHAEKSERDIMLARLNRKTDFQLGVLKMQARFKGKMLKATSDQITGELRASLQARKEEVLFCEHPQEILAADGTEEESIFEMQTYVRAIVTDQFLVAKRRPKLEFPNEKQVDQLALLEEWWDELDPGRKKIVKLHDFADFLLEKKVITKAFEAARMIKVSCREVVGADGYVTKTQYRKLTAKVLLRSTLMNIYYYLQVVASREGLNETPESYKEKIAHVSERDKIDAMLHHLVKY
jgi:hypothetical protein